MFRRVIRICFYTFSMYVVTHLVVFVLLPFGLLVSAFNKKRIPKLKKRFVEILFRLVGKKPEVLGLENIEEGKAYLIVPNYPSFYASFAMIGVFPEASIVAHAFILKVPLLSQFLRQMGAIFVNPKRGRSALKAIDMGLKFVGGITSVLIFPEGQRTPDGQIHKFKRGFIYILKQSSLDLLPVTLNGFYRMKPMKRFYFDPDTKPEIIIHKSISNSRVREMSEKDLLEETTNIIGRFYRP